ncbi:MAG: low temperature requirement protein A [Actinobacteria bacterium]|nr:low temperature requirement protein A [Thermoleophilia bacterium]MCB9012051.1 low temperature requirement protein A [Actinomycetota bacterium]
MTTTPPRRLGPSPRDGDSVSFLELFFDLVFVLAFTQATALMAADPTWSGIARGLLVLAVMWWSWGAYTWLTSVVDPEAGITRGVIFGAMAALLVCALAMPQAFGEYGLLFAAAYAIVRIAHIWLFILASRGEDAVDLRRSVSSLGVSTLIAVTLLGIASQLDGLPQGTLWVLALIIDLGGPYLFGAAGWRLVPHHFAERHGLVVILALGESIVAIGIGVEGLSLGVGEVMAAVLGVGVACGVWWLYFDVIQLVAARRLEQAAPGVEQNTIARDSFSYLHYPMIAAIILMALGFKKTIGHVGEHLHVEVATALMGGMALYLLAHVAFRWRNVHRFSTHRVVAAVVCLASIPLVVRVPSLAALAMLMAIVTALIAYEVIRFRDRRADLRARLRH